jgi:XTP/dITP diphosphohydrolase
VSPPLPRLVVASANPGKLRELAALLAGRALEIVPQSALGIAPAAETESSFEGNALLKARHAARGGASAALADDSGLEVDALGGRPGVFSARFAGEGASDEANNRRLLESLAGVPEPRRARYRCVIVLVRGPGDPLPLIASGRWEGRIALAPRGGGGFGYDPLFLVGEGPTTAAELPAAVKNQVSHRALALRALLEQLDAA